MWKFFILAAWLILGFQLKGQDIEPVFNKAYKFNEGLAPVQVSMLYQSWGLIDKTGKFVVNPQVSFGQYGPSAPLTNGVIPFEKASKWGYIDKSGREIITPKYSMAYPFHDDLAAVKADDKYGFINKAGTELSAIKYEIVRDFSEGLASVRENNKWGYINKSGKEVIPFLYEDAKEFSEGLAPVKLNGKYGYVNKTGNTIIPFTFDEANIFSEGLAKVEVNGLNGYINKTGKLVIPASYKVAYNFKDGLAIAATDNKRGFIDKLGRIAVPFNYDVCFDFSEGLAPVKLNQKWGFVDKTGQVIIPFDYNEAYAFTEGLAAVSTNNRWGYLKNPLVNNGKVILGPGWRKRLWVTFAEVTELQKKEPKKIIVLIDDNRWFDAIESRFTISPTLEYIQKNFYVTKLQVKDKNEITFKDMKFGFNQQRQIHELAIALLQGKLVCPTTVFLDEKISLLTGYAGLLTANKMHEIITYIGDEAYKKETLEDFGKKTYPLQYKSEMESINVLTGGK